MSEPMKLATIIPLVVLAARPSYGWHISRDPARRYAVTQRAAARAAARRYRLAHRRPRRVVSPLQASPLSRFVSEVQPALIARAHRINARAAGRGHWWAAARNWFSQE